VPLSLLSTSLEKGESASKARRKKKKGRKKRKEDEGGGLRLPQLPSFILTTLSYSFKEYTVNSKEKRGERKKKKREKKKGEGCGRPRAPFAFISPFLTFLL